MAAVTVADSDVDVALSSYPDSPIDEADANIPCKGCGLILEEGKAFELAGNRWHIDCFRCNTCGLLLDSDANLLLLGDGSLICNNCTYSCNACGNKIEDLAILTGDQAFCAACFRCRNCKKKIENLKYARTSQGIFCMGCHEAIMARRRKRSKASKQPSSAVSASGPPVLDKSLPALPPTQLAGPDMATDDISSARSPTSLHSTQRSHFSPISFETDSAHRNDSRGRDPHTSTLTNNYRPQLRTSVSSLDQSDDEDDQRGYLPMRIDTNIKSSYTPDSSARPRTNDLLTPDHQSTTTGAPPHQRDYFLPQVQSDYAEQDDGGPGANKSHVAYQEKGRSTGRGISASNTPVEATITPPTAVAAQSTGHLNQDFQLSDAPRTRSRKNSVRQKLSPGSAHPDSGHSYAKRREPSQAAPGSPDSGINPFDDPKLHDSNKIPRRQVPASTTQKSTEPTVKETLAAAFSPHIRSPSSNSASASLKEAPKYPVRTHSKQPDSPLRSNALEAPQRSAARSSAPSKSVANDDFIAPRAPPPPPPPPPADRERRNLSVHSIQSDVPISPLRSRFSKTGLSNDFTLDDDSLRHLRKDSTGGDSGASVLRRVSNAMRHGRSHSDRATNAPHHRKTSSVGQLEISGPINSNPVSPSLRDDSNMLRGQLRNAQQRIAELEAERASLEHKASSVADIKHYNSELRERRSTMAHLDTQRELAVRELETITDHLIRAKDTNMAFDIGTLKNEILHDLSASLQRLKEQIAPQIEELVRRRNELTDEISNLILVKDKGLQEFESLSSKNAQLNNLNSQLAQSIQDSYQHPRGPPPHQLSHSVSGLGIHHVQTRPHEALTPADIRPTLISRGSNDSPASHMSNDVPEVGEAQVLAAPQMVKFGKAQPKRFNWKKGGRDVAKNVTKGLKGAFARENEMTNGLPYTSTLPYSSISAPSEASSVKTSQISEPGKNSAASLAFFQKNGAKGGLSSSSLRDASMSNLVAFEPSVLFGSELVARCDYENRLIPAVVTRCIQEVEQRGMDTEGIYRKSGGTGQVQILQKGFDKDSSYDISDPDLDIHAVTSCLKQYFRKLPNPLITFEVYDDLVQTAEIQDHEAKCQALRAAIGSLPQAHRDVLGLLMDHLVRVVAQQAENLMTPLNISVVFAPTIMRPLTIEREMTDMMAQRETVRALLDNASLIFD